MRLFSALLCAAALAGALPSFPPAAFAAEPAPAPAAAPVPTPATPAAAPQAAPQALSPVVQSAIADLSSDDFKTREAALAKLQIDLGEQMRALISTDDPEVQARITTLIQFQDGLSRWVLDCYKLPDDQRKATINFGLQPKVLPILAKIFSADNGTRVAGIKELGKVDGAEATALLGRLLSDPDRPVYVAAMEAVWDRKPDSVIVDALWDRAVDAGFAIYNGGYRQAVAENVTFRGKPLGQAPYQDNTIYRRSQDGNIACDVLINLKAPEVAKKIKEFLEGIDNSKNAQMTNMFMYNSNIEPIKNVFRLIEAYKSKEVVGALYKLVMAPVRQRQQGNVNNEKFFYSNRTAALATLITVIDQKPSDYNIKRSQMLGGVWSSETEANEDAAVKAIQKWWSENGDKYDDKTAAKSSSTQPAAQKADEQQDDDVQPGGNIAPGVRIIRHGPLIIQGQAGNGGNVIIRAEANVQVAPAAAPATAPATAPAAATVPAPKK